MGCEVSSADAKQVTEFKEFVVNVILHIHSADASTALGGGRKRRHLQGWQDADTALLLCPEVGDRSRGAKEEPEDFPEGAMGT